MTTAKKIAVALAVCAILIGLLLSFIAIFSMNVDLDDLNTINFEQKTYDIRDNFTKISISGAECDVKLLPTEKDHTTIQCSESDKIYHNVKVEDDTLSLTRVDSREWFEHFGIYWAEMEIVIYLPESEYEEFYVKTLSGDIKIPDNFIFGEAKIISTSGDIEFSAKTHKDLKLHSVSGDIHISKLSAENIEAQATSGDITLIKVETDKDLTLKTVSGEIEGENITCKNLTSNSTSGGVEFEELISDEKIKITTVSGEIGLENCDGAELKLKSTSGNIHGKLLSGKDFYTNTTSGTVNVPRSSGGRCDISTTSGNIYIKISE